MRECLKADFDQVKWVADHDAHGTAEIACPKVIRHEKRCCDGLNDFDNNSKLSLSSGFRDLRQSPSDGSLVAYSTDAR